MNTRLTITLLLILILNNPEYSLAFTGTNSTYILVYRNRKVMEVYANDTLVKRYKIAVGKKQTPTPTGEYKVVVKVANPGWYPKGKPPVEAGKDNPLGTRWMGLDIKGFGIHGTNAPTSIGKSASHGCIRMHIKDVEELFQQVSVGTSVKITDAPNLEKSNLAAYSTLTGDQLHANTLVMTQATTFTTN